jgi:hypothetical protein
VWTKAKLHANCHVQFELCYYSAPFRWLHQELWLEVGPSAVRIYHDHELVAVHARLFKPGDRSTVQDHLPPDAQAYFMRDPQWCLAQAKAVGPACRAVIESMFGKGVLDYLRAAQGLLGLRTRFTALRLEAACARALNFGAPTYRTIKQILKEGLDQQPTLFTATELEAPYRGGALRSQAVGPAALSTDPPQPVNQENPHEPVTRTRPSAQATASVRYPQFAGSAQSPGRRSQAGLHRLPRPGRPG